MPRKVIILAAALIAAWCASHASGGELYQNLAQLARHFQEARDIEFCSYTAPGDASGNASHGISQTPEITPQGVAGWCDPCRPGALGLLGSPGAGSAITSDRSDGVKLRTLFPETGPRPDANSRGSTWLWVGPNLSQSQLLTAGDTELGISEGIISGYRLTPSLGVFGAIAFSHEDGDTFIFSSVGIQKFGNPQGGGLLQRGTVWVFWEQGVDTLDEDDGHFQQLRFKVGLVGPGGGEAGMTFNVPLDKPADYFLSPVGGTAMTSTGGFTIGPYVRFPIGIFDLNAMLGYAEQSGSAVLGLGTEARLTERSAVFVDWKTGGADVGENPSTLLVGYKLGFGRADTTRY